MSAGNFGSDADRGGLHYRIETSGDFASLDAFLNRLETAKARIESLKRNRVLVRGGSDRIPPTTTRRADPEVAHRREMARSQARRAAIAKEGKESLSFFERLRRELNNTDNQANRISFTFRRLFGILAAFTIARQGTALFAGMVREMVSFNARMETAELGIAQLISSLTEIRDPLGNAVGAAVRFDTSLAEARKQMDMLRRDSLLTAATFEELIDTFQVSVAPGLSAGLNLEEVRRLTLMISRAATAIGLPQNQLAEEVRSLVQGTITPRNTRIATAMGITNEQVRNAQEAGQLFEFLSRRFSAFEESAEKTAQSFEALFSRLRGAVSLVLGAGGEGLFERTRGLLNTLFDLLVSENPLTGIVEPAPQAVRAINAISDAFSSLVDEAQRLLRVFDVGEIMVFGNAIASAIRNTSALMGAFVQGTIQGFNDIRSLVTAVVNSLRSIPGFSLVMGDSTRDFVAQMVRLVVILTSVRLAATLLLGPLLNLIAAAKVATVAVFRWVFANNALLASKVRLQAAGKALLGLNFATWASSATGAIKGLNLALLGLIARFAVLPTVAFVAGKAIGEAFKKDLAQAVIVVEEESKHIGHRIKGFVERVGDAAAVPLRRLLRLDDDPLRPGIFEDMARRFQKPAQEAENQANQTAQNIEERFRLLQQNIETDLEKGISVVSGILGRIQSIFSGLSSPGGIPEEALGVTQETVQSVADVFKEMPGLIANAVRPLDDMEQVSERLKDNLEQARNQLEQALMSRGMSGAAQQQVRALVEAEQERVKLREDMQNQETGLRRSLLGLENRQQRLNREAEQARQSGEDWTAAVDRAVASYRRMTEEQAKVSQIQSEIALLETQREFAVRNLDQRSLPGINAKLEQQRKLLHEQQVTVNQIIDDIAQQESLNQQQVDRLREQVSVEGLQKITSEQLNDVLTVRADLEQRINDIRDARLRTILAESQEEERLALRKASLELQNTQQQTAARTVTQQRRADADIQVRNLREELNLLGMVEAKELEALQAQMMVTEDQELLNGLQERYDAILARNNAKVQELGILLAEAERVQQRAIDAAERPISAGIEEAADRLKREAPDSFQIVSDTMVATAEQMSQAISGSIADAFDPLTDGSILNRVSSFFSSIGRMIIEMTTQMMVFRAMASFLNPAGAASGGSTTAIAQGAYKGGPTNAFARAKGFFRGGRPSGLHPTDTIPIWTAPGEWVIRAASVAKYGDAVMQRINAGLVDPTSLAALAGVRTAASVTVPRGMGRAMGGPTPRQEPRQVSSAAPASSTGPAIAVIAPTGEAFRRLLEGGRNEMLDFLSRNGFQPA